MTVDCIELNETAVAESASPRQNNEIIIAVPAVSSTSERKPPTTKRAAIISFEEEENASIINNNVPSASTPPTTTMSLADACLKYQEKQKLSEDKPNKQFVTDSTYERLHASESINIVAAPYSHETDFIEPESPTAITIFNPTATEAFPSLSNSYDYKETDSSMSKATDSSSITSNTTTHSSNSPPHQATSQQSHSSMNSSICSVHNNSPDASNTPNPLSAASENQFTSRIEEQTIIENEHIHRIQELEKRCASLEDQVSALTQWVINYFSAIPSASPWIILTDVFLYLQFRENARLRSIHHNLIMNRQGSRHFFISIPRVLLQRREGKKYFAYEIQIMPLMGGDTEKWSVLRRYSEFHRLDKYLQMSNPMVKTLDFPPKKSFGNMVRTCTIFEKP